MSAAVPIALFGWPFVVAVLFALLPPRRAVIASFVFAWLFLPMAGYSFEGWPGYTKMSATAYGALLGVILFDGGRLAAFRPGWVDLPIVVWCLTPMASSLVNGLGAYDGASHVFGQIVAWGIPYFVGRLYFSDLEGLRELAIGVFIGGLIYVPLCLLEMRISPQLHSLVYGYHQHDWRQTMRGGGWRPTVFMQHGLAVGMWMTVTSLVGLWLWRTGAVRKLWGVPMGWLVGPAVATAVLCRSFGALALLAMGTGVLYAVKWAGLRVAVLALAALPMLYIGVRATGMWDGSHLVEAVSVVSPDRVGSLQYRLEAEDILAEHALQQPVFGWGTWGRNLPRIMGGREDHFATDGLWIITLGQRGVVGLGAVTAVILLPLVLMWRRMPVERWSHPRAAAAAVLAVTLGLFMIDCLFNAMLNPIYLLAAGGLSGALLGQRAAAHRPVGRRASSAAPPFSIAGRRAASESGG